MSRIIRRLGVWSYFFTGLPFAAAPFLQHALIDQGLSDGLSYGLAFVAAMAGVAVITHHLSRTLKRGGDDEPVT